MIKNIIFAITLVLSTCSQLYSMNQESPEQFTIQTNDYNVRFRRVDLHKLYQQDRQNLTKLFGDYDRFQEMFGTAAALMLKGLYYVSPDIFLNYAIQKCDQRLNHMQSHQKIMYYWILENLENDDFIGLVSISTYIFPQPTAVYKDHLVLQIEGMLTDNYQTTKIVSEITRPALKKLESWAPFNDTTFCYCTKNVHDGECDDEFVGDYEYMPKDYYDNSLVVNAELLYSYKVQVDFSELSLPIKTIIPLNVYVIPKEKK